MNIEGWVAGYKIRAFPWIDAKLIYFNVQYYAPGQSLEKPPVWSKTVFITDDAEGRRLVSDFTHSLTELIAKMPITDEVEITIST